MTTYKNYADALQRFQDCADDLNAVLDPDNGFAPQLALICKDTLDEEEAENEIDTQLEQDTWKLVQVLVGFRKTQLPPYVPVRTLHEYTPTSDLVDHIVRSSPFLSELIAIREWLQDTAPEPLHPEVTNGYWLFTKAAILHAKRTGGPTGSLVKEMDPDALLRGSLAPDDENFEKNFCSNLFAYVRAGDLDSAYELCRKANQPWRAASIRGTKLFQWRDLSAGDSDLSDSDDGTPEPEREKGPRGTQSRRLWKAACVRGALSQNQPMHERVLFAALAPSPQTFGILNSACRTYADRIWATVCVVCEDKISSELAKLSNYWEGTLGNPVDSLTEAELEAEDEAWRQEKTELLNSLQHISVEDGPGPDHPYNAARLSLMVDNMSQVFDLFAEELERTGIEPSPAQFPFIRFYTHLALYLKLVDLPVPPDAVQTILQAYLKVLEYCGLHDLIALYAAALGDNAVTRYATFLVGAENIDRRTALSQAREHGLDVDRVAEEAATLTINNCLDAMPSPLDDDELPSLGPPTELDEMQLRLIRSIEWTTFSVTTYKLAMEQFNAISRYFLAMGMPHPVELLLADLPVDVVRLQDDEHIQHRDFFTLWRLFDKTTSALAELQPHAREKIAVFEGLLNETKEMTVRFLKADWMMPGEGEDTQDERAQEMDKIRRIYIPEFVMRLHNLLVASTVYVPGAPAVAMQLVKVVADDRYGIYDAFSGRLPEYVEQVRGAVVASLEAGRADPFAVLQEN